MSQREARRLLHRDPAGRYAALIPPFEGHILENGGDRPAVTIHVYGGQMPHCHIFGPVEGSTYRRRCTAVTHTT